MVSFILADLDRVAKMEAKCSSLTVRGIVCVMEIGRWREKKLDRLKAKGGSISDLPHTNVAVAA